MLYLLLWYIKTMHFHCALYIRLIYLILSNRALQTEYLTVISMTNYLDSVTLTEMNPPRSVTLTVPSPRAMAMPHPPNLYRLSNQRRCSWQTNVSTWNTGKWPNVTTVMERYSIINWFSMCLTWTPRQYLAHSWSLCDLFENVSNHRAL